VEKAILYGSRASDNYKPASDSDLTLSGPDLNLTILNKSYRCSVFCIFQLDELSSLRTFFLLKFFPTSLCSKQISLAGVYCPTICFFADHMHQIIRGETEQDIKPI
jgi:hypothetical protein